MFSTQANTSLESPIHAPIIDHPGSANSRKILAKFSARWPKLTQVKRDAPDPIGEFDAQVPDFLPALLPFGEHPLFTDAPPQTKQNILSLGWLIYNWKTIDIEEKLISPVCHKIIHGDLPGHASAMLSETMGQTLVDEAYHILMVVKACEHTLKMRNLPRMKISTDFALVNAMHEEQAQASEPWQRDMIQLAISIVSEVFISDYLDLLASTDKIQPVNRMVVIAHRRDEFRHSPIFKLIAKDAFANMNREQRAFFCEVLPKPVRWFASHELEIWRDALNQLGFEHTNPLINDTATISRDNLAQIDYSELITLAADIGILDTAQGTDSFYREGLLH